MFTMDRNFKGKRYYAGSAMFKQDKFADLDLRTMLGPGIGYRFYDSKSLNLKLEIGPYYLKDNFISQPNESFWVAAWFLDYDSEPALDAETTDQTLKLKLGYKW